MGYYLTITLEGPSGYVLEVPVEVKDERTAYGRQDVLISVIGGKGEAWVSADRVKVRRNYSQT